MFAGEFPAFHYVCDFLTIIWQICSRRGHPGELYVVWLHIKNNWLVNGHGWDFVFKKIKKIFLIDLEIVKLFYDIISFIVKTVCVASGIEMFLFVLF